VAFSKHLQLAVNLLSTRMLSYQHIYHAGNFADIHKHTLLCKIIEAMKLKDKPITYVETHGGRAIYDIASEEAQKTKEYEDVKKHIKSSPADTYTAIQAKAMEGGKYYGSAKLAQMLLGGDDSLFLGEAHSQEYGFLKDNLGHYDNCHLSFADGYKLLASKLPLKRGLVFIDPSYEVKTEYQQVISTLETSLAKCPTAVFVLWYPILKSGLHLQIEDWARDLDKAFHEKLHISRSTPRDKNHLNMYGSGMLVINFPHAAK
jgi:23S rRNA (adenine2030-N6)-methyltransferase